MPVTCPIDLDVAALQAEIASIYTQVAADPAGDFHFHRGAEYAVTRLGYERGDLAALPATVTASFAGLANPHAIGRIPEGSVVLDVGCGAGTDLLIAAHRVGPRGRAIGVDTTEAMRRRAREGAAWCGLSNVDVREGEATRLPVDTASIDVLISNGVLNLVPDKRAAIAEFARVVRPGGRVQLGDVIISGEELPDRSVRDASLWAGWIAGALPEAELIEAFSSGGFEDVRVTAYFDCFAGTSKQRTAKRHGVLGVNLAATRQR